MTEPDPTVGPPYGGSPDSAADAPSGDVVELLRHEHEKVTNVFEEVTLLLDPEPDAARQRLGSAARELIEHLAASARVVWGAIPAGDFSDDPALQAQREREDALAVRLSSADSLTPDLEPGDARILIDQALDVLRDREDTLLPWLTDQPEDRRRQLGDDLQQVAG
jgi:hypothetical protein